MSRKCVGVQTGVPNFDVLPDGTQAHFLVRRAAFGLERGKKIIARPEIGRVCGAGMLDTFARDSVALRIALCRRSSVEERGSHNP